MECHGEQVSSQKESSGRPVMIMWISSGKLEDRVETCEVTDATETVSGRAKMDGKAQGLETTSADAERLISRTLLDSGRNHVKAQLHLQSHRYLGQVVLSIP